MAADYYLETVVAKQKYWVYFNFHLII